MVWLVLLAAVAAEAEDPYVRALTEGRRALHHGRLDEAGKRCRAALRASGQGDDGGARAAVALQLCGRTEIRRKHPARAARAFREALFFVPADRRLRSELRRAWERALRLADRPTEPARTLAAADRIVDRFERRPRRTRLEADLRALDDARRTLQEVGDERRAAYARALRHRLLARSGKPEAALQGIDRTTALRTRAARQLALVAEAEAWLALDQPRRAAQALARREAGRDEGAFEPSGALLEACRRVDDEDAPGTCARLVHEATGAFMVSDRRADKRVRMRDPVILAALHEEATLYLQDCLVTLARSDPGRLRGATLELSWIIDRDGRAIDPDIRPRRYRNLLDGCLEERLAWLRYPRLESGVRENVTLAFSLR